MSRGWSALAGQRVGVWGLGVEGQANLRRLAVLGVRAAALVVDAPDTSDVIATGAGGLEALAGCDVVVKTPGISRYREDARWLVDQGVALVGGMGLWLEEADRDRVLCVTGTKGKSTTTALTGHLATGLGRKPLLGGNFGTAPWDPVVPGDHDLWVVETSSYQATDVTTGPAVVAVTSLSQDHLDWHGGVEPYVTDKLSLCTRPGVRTVLAADGAALRERTALLGPVTWVADAGERWPDGLGLVGDHNRSNALVAAAALRALGVEGADDEDRLAAATAGFGGLGSRLRPIGTVDGVTFVDDSLSTNVLPTLAAVSAYAGRRLALLVGGHDRGIDYQPLADGLAERAADLLVLTLPASGPRIGALLPPSVEVRDCAGLEEAVTAGHAWARPDGVVLLSPAAPSFGVYRDYADRAAAFARAVDGLR